MSVQSILAITSCRQAKARARYSASTANNMQAAADTAACTGRVARPPTFISIAQQVGCLVHKGTCLLSIQLLQGADPDPGSKALQDEGNAFAFARGHRVWGQLLQVCHDQATPIADLQRRIGCHQQLCFSVPQACAAGYIAKQTYRLLSRPVPVPGIKKPADRTYKDAWGTPCLSDWLATQRPGLGTSGACRQHPQAPLAALSAAAGSCGG